MAGSGNAFSNSLDALLDKMRQAGFEGTQLGAEDIRDQARLNASGPPGPNIDTGGLVSKIQAREVEAEDEDHYRCAVESGFRYSKTQEYGAVVHPTHSPYMIIRTGDGRPRDPGHDVYGQEFIIPPRPYFGPAFGDGPRGAAGKVRETYVTRFNEARGA